MSGVWVHRIDKIFEYCLNCGPEGGIIIIKNRPKCRVKYEQEHKKSKQEPYTKYKDSYCIRCGFIPEDSCQLDVDHIDGNHSNNEPDNLQTLCANCHRLKSKHNGDFVGNIFNQKVEN